MSDGRAFTNGLGLTLEDMRGVPGGDTAIALIAPAPGKAALAIVIDVTGKLPQANAMLAESDDCPIAARAPSKAQSRSRAVADPVIQFDLPQLEENKEAARSTLRGSEKSEAAKTPRRRRKNRPRRRPARHSIA